jgi:hypothetical protein
MEVVHLLDTRRFSFSRQMRPGFNLESESSTVSGGRLPANDSNETSRASQPDVARRFMKMNELHDRIRKEILGKRQRKLRGYPASHKTTREAQA